MIHEGLCSSCDELVLFARVLYSVTIVTVCYNTGSALFAGNMFDDLTINVWSIARTCNVATVFDFFLTSRGLRVIPKVSRTNIANVFWACLSPITRRTYPSSCATLKRHQSSTQFNTMPRPKTQHTLTESQKLMYSLEKNDNFRWIAWLLASTAPASQLTLTPAQRISPTTQLILSGMGQFAELSHGSIDVDFVWRNLPRLMRPDYPLEGYDALAGSKLMCVFHGDVANLQGFVAYRPELRQLVMSFSGTSSAWQALHDVDARLVSPKSLSSRNFENYNGPQACVHAGFWRLFQGIKDIALKGLEQAFKDVEVDELVLASHSLGGAVSAFFILHFLDSRPDYLDGISQLCLLTLGSPRVGNVGLKEWYQQLVSEFRTNRGEDAFVEFAVKGYNDGTFQSNKVQLGFASKLKLTVEGVHCLPPMVLGFHHLSSNPLYLYHGFLYRIPERFSEFSKYEVEGDDDDPPPDYPLGGHNYYNNRDMEKCLRHFQWLGVPNFGNPDSERRYLDKVADEKRIR